MADIKEYVNYNLSLVDPTNIEIETPIENKIENKVNVNINKVEEVKEELEVSIDSFKNEKEDKVTHIPDAPEFNKDSPDVILLNPIEQRKELNIESEERPEKKLEYSVILENPNDPKDEDIIVDESINNDPKENVDITTYALNEPRISAEEESNIDINKDWQQVGNIKEYPVDPFDEEFKTHKLIDRSLEQKSGIITPTNEQYSMGDFKVTAENKGKLIIPKDSEEKLNGNFEVKVLDQKYEKVKAKDEPSQYNRFVLRNNESGKDPNLDEELSLKNNLSVRILDQKYEREKPKGAEPVYKEIKTASLKEAKDDSINIMDLSDFAVKKIAKTPYDTKELSYEEVTKALNQKGQFSNLGALHVYPVNPSVAGGISSKYVIPFEFNPKISESGVSAKYETSSLLSRVGDIHSYIKTDSSSITLNTKYQVLSVKKEEASKIDNKLKGDNNGVGSWMEIFHLRTIQSIEMAYRGLVYPQTSKEQGSFFRPPIVKIVFGNLDKTVKNSDGQTIKKDAPFSNMLMYPYKMGSETKTYYKTFIVSKVDIKKDWDNYPLILNKEHDGIIDLQGFDVSLNLLEIDPMYIGVLPSFEDYYSTISVNK